MNVNVNVPKAQGAHLNNETEQGTAIAVVPPSFRHHARHQPLLAALQYTVHRTIA